MPTILHADMDAFYASVEQRDRPELRGKPVIVSGDSARSVVTTASYEARVYGVHSAMPALHAHKLCPHGIFVPPRMQHYVAIAKQIRGVFEEFTPLVEPLSLDEAFLDVSGSLKLFGGGETIARRLRERVREVTQLTVSVGIASTKMVAKIASARCKPDGLLVVEAEQVRAFLDPLDVDHLWGVGATTRAALQAMGITTIGVLARSDAAALERRLGRLGRDLWELAQGNDLRTVEPDRQRKSYGEEQTFERDQKDSDMLRRVIAEQAEAVSARLRHDDCEARTVILKMKLTTRLGPGKYPILTRRLTLERPTSDGRTVRDAALQLWDANKHGTVIRLIGVAVTGIEARGTRQLSLFDRAPADSLNRALDRINQRFGNDVIKRGG